MRRRLGIATLTAALVVAAAPAARAGYTHAGEFTVPPQAGSPPSATDMERGPQERPYLETHFMAKNLVRGFDPDGTAAVTATSDDTFARGLAIGSDGRIYLAEVGLVRVFSATGVQERTFPVPEPGGDEYSDGNPMDLAIDGSGRLYFLEQGDQNALRPSMLMVFENDGTFVRSFEVHDVTEERHPHFVDALAVDGTRAYLLWNGDEVRVFDLATGNKTATLFAGPEDQPGEMPDGSLGQLAVARDLELGPDGSLYVADCWSFQRVQRFTPGGQLLDFVEGGSADYTTSPSITRMAVTASGDLDLALGFQNDALRIARYSHQDTPPPDRSQCADPPAQPPADPSPTPQPAPPPPDSSDKTPATAVLSGALLDGRQLRLSFRCSEHCNASLKASIGLPALVVTKGRVRSRGARRYPLIPESNVAAPTAAGANSGAGATTVTTPLAPGEAAAVDAQLARDSVTVKVEAQLEDASGNRSTENLEAELDSTALRGARKKETYVVEIEGRQETVFRYRQPADGACRPRQVGDGKQTVTYHSQPRSVTVSGVGDGRPTFKPARLLAKGRVSRRSKFASDPVPAGCPVFDGAGTEPESDCGRRSVTMVPRLNYIRRQHLRVGVLLKSAGGSMDDLYRNCGFFGPPAMLAIDTFFVEQDLLPEVEPPNPCRIEIRIARRFPLVPVRKKGEPYEVVVCTNEVRRAPDEGGLVLCRPLDSRHYPLIPMVDPGCKKDGGKTWVACDEPGRAAAARRYPLLPVGPPQPDDPPKPDRELCSFVLKREFEHKLVQRFMTARTKVEWTLRLTPGPSRRCTESRATGKITCRNVTSG